MKGDPHYLTAKYPGRCASCGADIARGDRAFYYPSSRRLMGAACGCAEKAARDFEAARQDEATYNGAGY